MHCRVRSCYLPPVAGLWCSSASHSTGHRVQIWISWVLEGWEKQRRMVAEPEARRGDREMLLVL